MPYRVVDGGKGAADNLLYEGGKVWWLEGADKIAQLMNDTARGENIAFVVVDLYVSMYVRMRYIAGYEERTIISMYARKSMITLNTLNSILISK